MYHRVIGILHTVYYPSSSVVKEDVRKIHDVIETLERGNPQATIIALGDFNSSHIHLPHFYQQVSCTTRRDKILDKCYVNIKNSYKSAKLPGLGNSDHNCVFLLPTYKHKAVTSKPVTVIKRIWSDDNMRMLLSCLDDTDWSELLSSEDINTVTDVFVEYLNFSIDECIPTRQVKLPGNCKSWITPKIIWLIGKRHNAHNISSEAYSRLKAQVQREIRKAKHRYAADIESKMLNSSRVAWSNLKSILKLKNHVPGCSLDANVLNTFFNRFDKPHVFPALPALDVSFDEFSVEEVYATLCGVNVTKSQGPDMIPARLLKSGAQTLAEPLTTIFNLSLQHGIMPEIWKTAIIKPVPKCAGAAGPKDFRPIALTSVIGKCLERLVMKRLAPKLNDPSQFAYQPNKSTEDALISVIDTVTDHLDRNAKNSIRALFIDFSSAFNTINPATMIRKLQEHDVHPNIINWIYDFLTNRKQRVQTTLNTSASINTSTGSPQGCVISPLLFSLYVADMPISNTNIRLVKYADDTVIIELVPSDRSSKLQAVANSISQWCHHNDLVLNAKKTKEMIICNARDSPSQPVLLIDNSEIEQVDHFTYLGTVLTSKLDFKENTIKTTKKARKRLHIIAKLYHLGVNEKLIETCYKSFIESILTYHLVVVYQHMSAESKRQTRSVIRTAEYLSGDLGFTSLSELYQSRLKTKSLRMVATANDPVLQLVQLPSGRYTTVKHRTQLRAKCFRAQCIKLLNSVFGK